MLHLVIGQSASGKSRFAEEWVCHLPGPRIYLATMQPFGEEARERIARHRQMRTGRGFVTLECTDGIARVLEGKGHLTNADGFLGTAGSSPATEGASSGLVSYTENILSTADLAFKDANLLLEDLPNLLANAVFSDNEDKPEELLSLLLRLSRKCASLTIVSGDLLSGGLFYGEETLAYLRALAELEKELARAADTVVEVAAGIPWMWKGNGKRLSGYSFDGILRFAQNDKMVPQEMGMTPDGILTENSSSPKAPLELSPHAWQLDYFLHTKYRFAQNDREKEMILIIGPCWSGKTEYARQIATSRGQEAVFVAPDLDEVAALARASISRSQEHGARSAECLQSQDFSLPSEPGICQSAKSGEAEKENPEDVEESRNICRIVPNAGVLAAGRSSEEIEALAEELSSADIVIVDEVGGGVVPIDSGERSAREASGRLACLLAERAAMVVRVFAGIPQVLKPLELEKRV